MHSHITTTHAIPKSLPAGAVLAEGATVKCQYCAAILGHAYDLKGRAKLQAAHKCTEKRRAKRPAVALPFN